MLHTSVTSVCVPMVRWLWHIPLNQTRISLVGEFLYWGIPSEQGPRCLSRLVTKNLEPLFTADRNKEVAGVIKEEEQEGHLLKIRMPPCIPWSFQAAVWAMVTLCCGGVWGLVFSWAWREKRWDPVRY